MNELTQRLTDFARDSPLERITDNTIPFQLFLKRDDLLHPLVSGNKWRKLKYNLIDAQKQGLTTLLTFGGAYSNHLYATAAAGKLFGFKTIGVVRGDELQSWILNKTLTFCQSCGMYLHFVNRDAYRRKEDPDFRAQFGGCYLIPEGGTNELAVEGTAEIMPEIIGQLGFTPDYVCCAVGTGGTVAGLIQSAPPETTVLGFLVLKAPDFQLPIRVPATARYQLMTDYHFGGYAKTTPDLLDFIRSFEHKTGVLLEQVYTAKMLFGIYNLAGRGFFPGRGHSGGGAHGRVAGAESGAGLVDRCWR